MEGQTETNVADLASEWGAKLAEASEADPSVKVAGTARSLGSSPVPAAPPPAPKITGKDVEPLIRALGSFGCRVAKVSDMSKEEAEGIAEPSAALLSLMAPELPPWSIPAGVLAARLADFGSKRADEYRVNHPTKTEAQGGAGEREEKVATQVVEKDGF